MKRFIVMSLLIGGILVSLSAQASITRFAVVDLNRVITAFADQSAEARAFIQKRDQIQAEIEKRNKELQDLNAELAEAQEQGNQNQVRTLENQIRTRTQAAQTYITTNFAALERDRERLLRDNAIRTQLTTFIRAVAESEGYSMVLSREESSGILWYSPSVDITNRVIERIRSASPRR